MRTYSGHSTAKASNELYRTNLAKGQTGLSIAFDLPTQIGYDPDDPAASGEVGKVGVPVAHLGHMSELLDQIPVESMNTSMTINATAAWLLGLYIANAETRGVDPRVLQGTTQNDIVKEYLSRGTFIFPPLPSRRLTVDTIAYTVRGFDDMARLGAQVTIFRLGDDPGLARFIDQVARRVEGRVVVPDEDGLGAAVVGDYLRSRRRR
jgi:(2R)-ethylmalonyl-CoA mutase